MTFMGSQVLARDDSLAKKESDLPDSVKEENISGDNK
jgi:hypothetical protein